MTTCHLLGANGGLELPYHPPSRKASQNWPAAVIGSGMTREELFLSELALIERVIAWVCARRCLRGADGEDFGSTVKLRLIENDYEILGRFEGRSSLKTYLTVVINRLYIDYQNQRFGKWRPSAEARRLGPVALRLEALLSRDGLTLDEARGVLQTNFAVAESRDALYELSLKLPRRDRRKPDCRDDQVPPATAGGVSAVEQGERQALADRTFCALARALGRLPARDRIILRLHVEAELSMAEVAKALGEDQKALYRRRDTLFKHLRRDLEADGIGCRDAHELLSTLDWESALTGGPVLEQAGLRSSLVAGQEGES
jgi:RNA polymerase sigma factor for flagellar operon FliA